MGNKMPVLFEVSYQPNDGSLNIKNAFPYGHLYLIGRRSGLLTVDSLKRLIDIMDTIFLTYDAFIVFCEMHHACSHEIAHAMIDDEKGIWQYHSHAERASVNGKGGLVHLRRYIERGTIEHAEYTGIIDIPHRETISVRKLTEEAFNGED